MTVYVDPVVDWGEVARQRGLRWTKWCHLTADTKEELHKFAAEIGLKMAWFQNANNERWHYDIVPSKRTEAIRKGAVEIDRAGMAEIIEKRRKGG